MTDLSIVKSNEYGFDVFRGEVRLGRVYQISHDQYGVMVDREQRYLAHAGYAPTFEDGVNGILHKLTQ